MWIHFQDLKTSFASWMQTAFICHGSLSRRLINTRTARRRIPPPSHLRYFQITFEPLKIRTCGQNLFVGNSVCHQMHRNSTPCRIPRDRKWRFPRPRVARKTRKNAYWRYITFLSADVYYFNVMRYVISCYMSEGVGGSGFSQIHRGTRRHFSRWRPKMVHKWLLSGNL